MKNTIHQGHVLEQLNRIPPDSIHCVVTSPPYWSLRDYGLEPVTWPDGWCGQLGLEPSIELYVSHLVEVFREVRRVLHPSGVLFLVIGDSYATRPPGNKGFHYGPGRTAQGSLETGHQGIPNGLKPKDLCLIPARVAIALQDDGWWVRSDIIWAKDSPMPESVRDRPTKSHEYIFMLTKRGRYFWDQEAVREANSPTAKDGNRRGFRGNGSYTNNYSFNNSAAPLGNNLGNDGQLSGRHLRTVWRINQPMYHLRPDLTPEQRAFVLRRIADEGLHSSCNNDENNI